MLGRSNRAREGCTPILPLLGLFLMLFAGLPVAAQGAGSDEFDGPGLDTGLWTFFDDAGNGSVSVTGGQLQLSVPAGALHFEFNGAFGMPRVMQPITDEDFLIEVKFDSAVALPLQLQGIRVDQDVNNSFLAQYAFNGTVPVIIFGQQFDGVSTGPVSLPAPNATPAYMRVLREGDDWTISTSGDGVNYTVTTSFTRAMTVGSAGVFVGNYSFSSPPAHTALFDYFRKVTAPSIDVNPVGVTVTEPDAAVFDVSASGEGNLSYQWRRDGVDIPGANSAQLVVAPTSLLDDGAQFSVVVSNQAGSVTSAAATLNVNAAPTPPSILIEPADVSVFEPAAATFDVIASGAQPLSYQWQRNGADIPGATGSSYTLDPTSLADSGALFSVTVTNSLGTIDSRQALLSVSEAPESDAPSDEFDDPALDASLWTFIDPLGDSTLTMTGTQVSMTAIAGTPHFTWQGINSTPRIMQDAFDGNFVLEAKFDSSVSQPYQMQGFRIEQDADTHLVFEFNHADDVPYVEYIQMTGGSAVGPISTSIPSGVGPLYLQAERIGDTFNLSYSYDGQNWTLASTVVHPIAVNSVGLVVGNYFRLGVTPGHTALIDYFRRRDLPTITSGPDDLTVTIPAAATFSVTTDGPGPFTYQWRRDGVDIPGATGTSYTLNPTAEVDNGASFDVVVSNGVDSVTSRAAILTAELDLGEPPIAVDDVYDVPFNGTFDSLVSGGLSVLDNDSHPLGAAISAALVEGPQFGTLTLNADGTFNYTHDGVEPRNLLDPGAGNSLLEYGVATAIDGDTLVIGANSNESTGPKTGTAYVFRRNGVIWELEDKLDPSIRAIRQWFGWCADIEGDRIVIGAPGDPHAGRWSGAAFVFERGANGWEETARLISATPATLDEFGNSVSLSGDTLAIASYLDDEGAENSGSVYIFELDGNGDWNQTQLITPNRPVFDGYFGHDIELEGDRLAIGVMNDDEAGLDAGAVYIYERAGGTFTEQQKLFASDTTPGDTFGFTLALDGSSLVVGTNIYSDGFGALDTGTAYVFEFDGVNWNEVAKLEGPTPTDYGIFRFGLAVDIQGDRLAVGGHESVGDPEAGAVYLYRRDNGNWIFDQKIVSLFPADDQEFGVDVSLDGANLVVGASTKKFSFQPDSAPGSAYIYQIGGSRLDVFRYVAEDSVQPSNEATVELNRQP